MNEKKFYVRGIIVPAIGLLCHLFLSGMVLDLAFAVISIIMNLRKRTTHRIGIGIALAVVILLGSVFMTVNLIIIHNLGSHQTVSELLLAILFGSPFYG